MNLTLSRALTAGAIAVLTIGGLLTQVATTAVAQSPAAGGSVSVAAVGLAWPDLDPALDPHNVTDQQLMDAVFGTMFSQAPGGKVTSELATGYRFTGGGKTLTIDLRKNVHFTDGTPFDAKAVVYNFQRDFKPSNACTCLNDFRTVRSVTARGAGQVVLHLSQPDPEIIQAFIDNAPNWIASPKAIQTESPSAFGLQPIGAGPFTVESDRPNNQLVLSKNPSYWQKGHPYIDSLTFTSVGDDQPAYEAVVSGSTQIALGVTTVNIIQQAREQLQTWNVKGVSGMTLEFNAKKAPLNNILAREAITYATNPAQILKAVSPNYGTVVEAQTGPGSAYYEAQVPGYHAYNLAKAKALVGQLGGLSITIEGGQTTTAELELETLQDQLKLAGIKVTLLPESLATEEVHLASGSWIAVTGGSGGVDPDLGPQSLPRRFASYGSYTCCGDAKLDEMINQSIEESNVAARKALFRKTYQYIAENDYVDELYAPPTTVIAAKSLGGLTALPSASGATTVDIDWSDIYLNK